MDRLTEKRDDHNVIPLRKEGIGNIPKFALVEISDNTSFLYGDFANKLAAYEDTGLTPEEIIALKADNERLHKLVDTIQTLLWGNTETKEEK